MQEQLFLNILIFKELWEHELSSLYIREAASVNSFKALVKKTFMDYF